MREQKGADSFTPKSAPLGHKSGMSHREIEQTHITLLPISLVFYRTYLVVKQ